MKIAIHNTFYGGQLAETELARRLILAARNLGWDAVEVGSSDAIWQYQPDFVLNLHFKTPKITGYPTYGCLWHPSVLMETDDRFIRNILSYDAYLSASPHTDIWLGDLLYNTAKQYFIAPFFTSCNATVYREPQLQSPRLVYVGSNWDGERFKDLFLELERQDWIDIYGSSSGWSYLSSAYRGSLPFDGTSVLNVLHQAGVGLCLHRDEHTREGIPSMRIFEIVASGAIGICGQHTFIEEHFADTVLYLDTHLSTIEQVAQITEHLHWIATHPKAALEMSQAAHRIFVESFALEILLSNLQTHHQTLLKTKGFVRQPTVTQDQSRNKPIQLILNTGDRNPANLKRTLNSIQQQTYQPISILLVKDQEFAEVDSMLETYADRLSIQIIDRKLTTYYSSYLWSGIAAISEQYFGVLTSGVTLYPNHIYTLVSLLERFETLGAAYSEVIQVSFDADYPIPLANSHDLIDRATLAATQPSELTDFLPFNHFISINNFVARSSLIDEFLKQDPKLDALDDLFLLANLGARGHAMFSYEATCQIDAEFINPWTHSDNPQLQTESLHRIEMMMGDRELPVGQLFNQRKSRQQRLQQTEIDLQLAQQRIIAMESSKFWQLRQQWFQLKRRLGLNTENE